MAMPSHSLPKGTLFPFQPTSKQKLDEILDKSHMWCKQVRTEVVITTLDSSTGERVVMTRAPRNYFDLVRRFLWRRSVLHILARWPEDDKRLSNDIRNTITDHVVYMERILEHTSRDLFAASQVMPQGHVRLFEIFMTEECYVGRHEPSASWKDFGKSFGAKWDGELYQFNIEHCIAADREELMKEAVTLYGDYYDHPYAQMEMDEETGELQRVYAGDVLATLPVCPCPP
ncbi:hypothetical protein J3R83DRAFT_9191 [Lanmaoa asiatica]|nr:hypothetical protein J3R83DRAFT_9191 [Lanmaoa asiatica]